MKVLSESEEFRRLSGPIFLGVGFFDGVHLGHREVLQESIDQAKTVGGEAWVLTFDKHPLSVLAPSRCPKLMTTLEERLSLFENLGLDGALVLPFTRQLAVEEPEEFVRSICGLPASVGRIREIRCGDNWRFGKRAVGNPHLLAELGKRYGFRVKIVPYAFYQGTEISSTRIRTAVTEGRLEDAAAMLGRPFSLSGIVRHGRGEGGRLLHFPTANLLPQPTDVLPPYGVYAVRVRRGQDNFFGVADLGVRPTIIEKTETKRCILETHLFDFDGDLYGQTIRVSFLELIRPEKRFDSLEALSGQIARDVLVGKTIRQRLTR